MRFEILKELEQDDPKLEIPWSSPQDTDLRYQDLKAHPELIPHLEEALEFPALGHFLQTWNTPDSLFRTVKCGVWSTQELSEEERGELGQAHKLGAYVDLVFERGESNFALDRYLRLGEKLERTLAGAEGCAQVEFAIRRCLYHAKDSWGYYATLFIHAYGKTPAAASREGRASHRSSEPGIERRLQNPVDPGSRDEPAGLRVDNGEPIHSLGGPGCGAACRQAIGRILWILWCRIRSESR